MTTKRFEQRRAIITGASSGIGRATALRFLAEGARVAGLGRDLEALNQVAQAGDGRFTPIQVDLLQDEQRGHALKSALEQLGGLDILVNSAGMIEMGTLEAAPLEHFDRTMDLNVRVLYDLTHQAIPALIEAQGNVVNISSVAGPRAFPGVVAYCVSKAAVDQITRCAALELADRGVRVNSVNPGVIVTNLHRRGGMSEQAYGEFLERSIETHPLGRAGTAEEVAGMVAYLASDEAGWVTGATFAIDGGRGETCMR